MQQLLSKRDVSSFAFQNMRQLLMFSVPSLALLGLIAFSSWRWWRKRALTSRRSSACTQGQPLAVATVQQSPTISEDSGVVDAQAEVSAKGSHEILIVAAKTNGASSCRSSEKSRWKYPKASSDIQSETLSEVGSLSSDDDNVFSGSQHQHCVPSEKLKKIERRHSISVINTDEVDTEGVQKSVSTPTFGVSWANRKRVMVQLPRDLVGRFIGKQGRNIKSLMEEASGAHVYVNQKNLPNDAVIVPCTVQGTYEQVEQALKIIAMRYPELDLPNQLEKNLNLQQPFPSPLFGTPRLNGESWDTTLAPFQMPSSPFKAMVTYIESLSRLWIVPYDKSTELDEQHQSMSYTYCYAVSTGNDSTYASEGDESLLKKFCAVRVSDIHWLRGQMAKLDGSNYEVLLVDYGSTVIVPHTAIRPLRREHTTLSIQAFPCELANIVPNDAMAEDGLVSLQTLVEGMVLEVHITGQTSAPPSPSAMPSPESENKETEEESVVMKWFHIKPAPLVEIYARFGSDSPVFINRELVERGYAVWRGGPLTNES